MDLKRIVLYGTLAAHAGMASAARELSVIALFRDKALVEIDGRERLLTAGTGSPEGILLVSADSNEAVIEIDGRRQTYRLGDEISLSGVHFGRRASPCSRVRQSPRHATPAT